MPRDSAGNGLAGFSDPHSLSSPGRLCFGTGSADAPSFLSYFGVVFAVFMALSAMSSFFCASLLACFDGRFMFWRNSPFDILFHDSLKRPPVVHSLDQSVSLDANRFSQINGLVSSAVDINKSSPPLVALLDFFASPSAVFGRVRPIVVNAVKRISFWSRPHVLNKQPKISPPFADSNSSSTVLRVGRVAPVVAPSAHTQPNGVDWRFFFKHFSHQQTLNRNNSSTFHQIQQGVHFAS